MGVPPVGTPERKTWNDLRNAQRKEARAAATVVKRTPAAKRRDWRNSFQRQVDV